MKIRNKLLFWMVMMVLLSACTDPHLDNGKASGIKPDISISKTKEANRFKDEPNAFTSIDERILSEKRDQVLSSVDKGLRMIDNELNKDPHHINLVIK